MGSKVTYEIEGGFDFFKELKNMKTKSSSDVSGITLSSSVALQIEDKPVEKCLITDEKLTKDHITLKCGHKFNYVPLFKEVLFQKCSMLPKNVSSKVVTSYIQNTSSSSSSSSSSSATLPLSIPTMNTSTQPTVSTIMYNSSYNLETTKVNYNEIKCPYCRSITHHILPYYPYPDVSKVKYVNSPPDLALAGLTCEFHKHGSSKRQDDDATCRSGCIYHEKYDLMLCNKHFNKLETSVDLDKNISSTTRKGTSNRIKAKPLTGNNNENLIISHHNPATSVCSFMLLSGPRKGCPCGKPMWIPKTVSMNNGSDTSQQSVYCKTHYERLSVK